MFDNVVYLNRDVDVQRKLDTESQLDKYGIKATRFSAIDSGLEELMHQTISDLRISFAQASCLISHLEIIRQYGDKELIVFEDDVDISPSEHWGCSLKNIFEEIDPSIGIVQLAPFPSSIPVTPRLWQPGIFGTAAYLIRPWYSKRLIEVGYRDNKWDVSAFKSNYVQPLADSILYSNTPSLSVTLFGIRPVVSTILPHATYATESDRFGLSWAEGKNNIEDIKAALPKFKC